MSPHPSLPPAPPTATATPLTRRASLLAGVGLVLFMVAAMASTVWWVWGGDRHEFLPADATLPTVLNGTVSRQIADRLSDTPFTTEAAHLQRGLGWLFMGDLGSRVRQGCPGWLFLGDELREYPDGAQNAQTRARTVTSVQQALAARGAKLLVVVVPDKTRIEAEHLCGVQRPANLQPRIDDWIAAVHAGGVPAIDLTQALGEMGQDPFLRTDTHWNETGAGAAAQAVAARVRDMGIALQPAQHYQVTAHALAVRPGDLVHLAGLDWLPLSLQPQPESAQLHTYTAQGGSASTADDLFGDSSLPTIALIGTSFSRTSNFAPQLSQALGTAIGNFARDGGEFGGAANAYFTSPAYKQTPPRLVVWEVNERDLQAPLKNEDSVRP